MQVNGSQYLHLIKAIQGERYQIGNNIGRINGWITQNSILVFVQILQTKRRIRAQKGRKRYGGFKPQVVHGIQTCEVFKTSQVFG